MTYDFAVKANAGGQIDLKAVVGRNSLIQSLWEILEQQSVVMTAERRIGKTTLLKLMQAVPRAGWVPVFQDLEGLHSAMDFALSVYREVDRFLTGQNKAARRTKEWIQKLGGVEIGGVLRLPQSTAMDWKDVLKRSIEDLTEESQRADGGCCSCGTRCRSCSPTSGTGKGKGRPWKSWMSCGRSARRMPDFG